MAEKKKTKELTIEEAFAKAETAIEALEEEDLPLEKAFQTYREGMELVKYLDGAIDKMEQKVLQVTKDLQLIPFDEEDGEDDDDG